MGIFGQLGYAYAVAGRPNDLVSYFVREDQILFVSFDCCMSKVFYLFYFLFIDKTQRDLVIKNSSHVDLVLNVLEVCTRDM
jgi:hypothetical protein